MASRGPPSRAYRLRHVTITITKWLPKYGKLSGTSSFCPFGKVLRVLLAQIVLGSDCSGSVKELQRLLQPVVRNVSLKISKKKNRKKDKTTFGEFSDSKSRDTFWLYTWGVLLGRETLE